MGLTEEIKRDYMGTLREYLIDYYQITTKGDGKEEPITVLKRGVELMSIYSRTLAYNWLVRYLVILERNYLDSSLLS